MSSMTTLMGRYQRFHRPGQDCRMTSARNLLDMHGYRYSYATVQGLASSHYFTYLETIKPLDALTFMSTDMSAYYLPVVGQREEVYENLAYLFNATLVGGQDQPSGQAEQSMRAFIGQGVPVMVAVPRFALAQYHGKELRFPAHLRDMHFAGHFITIVGIDEASAMVTYFDSDHARPMQLPLAVLRQLRTLGDGEPNYFMQSRNRWAVFIPGPSAPPLKEAMRAALLRTLHNWKGEAVKPGSIGGMTGLRALCAALPGWAERADVSPDRLKSTAFLMRITSENISGGSLGRRGFGMFLRQASELLRAPSLAAAAGQYADLAEMWLQLMGQIDQRVFDPTGSRSLDVPEIRALLGAIVDSEERGLALLEAGLGELP